MPIDDYDDDERYLVLGIIIKGNPEALECWEEGNYVHSYSFAAR